MDSFIRCAWMVCVSALVSGRPPLAQCPVDRLTEVAASTATDGDFRQVAKLTASDGASRDGFGIVATSNDTLIVGAFGDDDYGSSSGSAYVFEKIDSAWTEVVKLTPDDGQSFDYFGYGVAVAKDIVLIGAYGDDDRGDSAGSAYVFERMNGRWAQTAKLFASDARAGSVFGQRVAIMAETIVVAAPGDAANAVYIFERNNDEWSQIARLTASDGRAGDWFGARVVPFGRMLLVSAPIHNGVRGAAYLFETNNGNWAEIAKLTASDGAPSDAFGTGAAAFGDTVVIGADQDDDLGDRSGAAYVFKNMNGEWVEAAKLTAGDGGPLDFFGFSIGMSEIGIVVGAWGRNDLGSESGSAYLFEETEGEWKQSLKLLASDGQAGDAFGSITLSGGTLVIGAQRDDDLGVDSGSAYVFERAGGCTGGERIAKAKCAGEPGGGVLKVQLAGGVPDDSFTVTLSTGPVKQGTLNGRGKGKVKFKRLPSLPGTATAEWGCGATDQRDYSCP